jgi:hypothetical protein
MLLGSIWSLNNENIQFSPWTMLVGSILSINY